MASKTNTVVKGDAESTYRTGDVNLTCANIGAATSSHTHHSTQNKSIDVSIGATGGALGNFEVPSVSGKTCVGVIGFESNKWELAFSGAKLAGNRVYWRVANPTRTAFDASFNFDLLYM